MEVVDDKFCLDKQLEIFRTLWQEEVITQLDNIFQGVYIDQIEQKLQNYVEETIEPAGWKAIWRLPSISENIFPTNLEADIEVDVINVRRDKLVADVEISRIVNVFSEDGIDKEVFANKQMPVLLKELYPLAFQENSAINIALTAQVVDLIRFFYSNIWRPWDLEEEECRYNEFLLSKRYKLYKEITEGKVPLPTAAKLQSIFNEAITVRTKIDTLEKSLGVSQEKDLEEKDVAYLVMYHKKLHQLKLDYEMLEDPVMRNLLSHQDLLENKLYRKESSKVKIVVDSVLPNAVISGIQQIPEILQLFQMSESTSVQSFPNLQLAVDNSNVGDIIIILPGKHSLQRIGDIGFGGVLIGTGDDVVIEGNSEAGDVLFDIDLKLKFILKNLTIIPAPCQTAVTVHTGEIEVHNVKISGSSTGITVIDSYCQVFSSSFVDCQIAIDGRGSANVQLLNVDISDCDTGIKLEEESKFSVKQLSIKNCNRGICFISTIDAEASKISEEATKTIMNKILKEHENVTLGSNQEDISLLKNSELSGSWKLSMTNDFHSSSIVSQDSGCGSGGRIMN